MQALIDFDGWRKWKDFSNQTTASTKDKSKEKSPSVIKTKSLPQPSDAKNNPSPRSATSNGAALKSKRLPSMQQCLDGIGEESRERSTSDETDNTDSNAEDIRGKEVAVGA